jgi:hypothetical protein
MQDAAHHRAKIDDDSSPRREDAASDGVIFEPLLPRAERQLQAVRID